jgi:hypothetical protein
LHNEKDLHVKEKEKETGKEGRKKGRKVVEMAVT